MAETLLAPAPTPTPPAPTPPAPTPSPEAPKGIAAAMAELDAGVEKLEKAAAAPEPPKAAPATPTEPPKAPATPEPEVEPQWDKAPKHLRNSHFKFKREAEEKISKAQAKILELEGKTVQSPADLQKIKDLEKKAEDLQKQVEERETRLLQADYSKSEEFKRLYVVPGDKAYKKAIADVKGLVVKGLDKENNEVERPATEADFNALRKLDPYEQDKKLTEMFGASAARVAWHISNLDNIEQQANDAIGQAREKSVEQEKVFSKQREQFGNEFKTHSEAAMTELTTKFKDYFAPDEANPEATKALEAGFKYVDNAATNSDKMSPKERAESTVIIRGLAAAAPRLMVEKRQLLKKITGLEEELSKYRKTSPTNGDLTLNPTTIVTEKPKGIAASAAEFDKLDK